VTKTTAAGVTNLAFAIPHGERGEQGYYVAEVAKKSGTGTPGSVDTYALKLNDAAESEIGTFTVRNGADGEGAGDMLMSVYDLVGDGAVDNAEKLGGELPSYYAAALALTAHTGSTSNPHAVTAAQVGAAAASHSHAAAEITSGTLPVSRGGTGQTSVDTAPTSGSSKMVTSGGVYLEIATLSATKMSKTSIMANTNVSPALGSIANNCEYRCTNASLTAAPTFTIPAIASTDTEFVAIVIFKAPNTAAPAVTNSSGYTLKYQGDGVSGGVFTPVAGTVYTMAIVFDGIYMNLIVSGVA
jgi:hypothetical protein